MNWYRRPRMLFLAIFAIAFLSGCERPVDLLSKVSEADANASVRVLRERGIDAQKLYRKEGVAVTVVPHQSMAALEILNAHGLPRGASTSLGDIFKRDGMVSTPLEERARLVHALSKELESIIEAIDGVVIARVLVVLPDRTIPGEAPKPPSASVFVKHRGDFDPDINHAHIARLVGSAVPGLSSAWRERVTVVFVQGIEPTAYPTSALVRQPPGGASPVLIAVYAAGVALGLVLLAGGVWWRRQRKTVLTESARQSAAPEASA